VSPRNKTNVALPFSRLTVQDPVKMTVGDWVSLAGLVISVIGFSVVIWQSIRTANLPEAARPPGGTQSYHRHTAAYRGHIAQGVGPPA
jgi:hypothetical protein